MLASQMELFQAKANQLLEVAKANNKQLNPAQRNWLGAPMTD